MSAQRYWWVGAWVCLLLLAGCGQADDGWARVQETAVLRVGIDPTYPPFASTDGRDVWGLEVDLARALAAELGAEAQFTYFGFDGLYDALLTQQVDVLISALVVDVSRTRDFAYSTPYYNAGEVLLYAAGLELQGWRDLHDQSVAVELGSPAHMEANRWQRRLRGLMVLTYDTADAAVAAVVNGRTPAALVDATSAHLFLRQHPQTNLQQLPDPMTVRPYALVVRKEDGRLLRQLNHALARLQTSSQLAQIMAKWLR